MNEIHQWDVGTSFTLTVKDNGVVVDVSGATTKQITFKNPSGSKFTKDLTFVTDGSDGQVRYITVSGDLNLTGTWTYQLYFILPSWEGRTSVHNFEVHKNL